MLTMISRRWLYPVLLLGGVVLVFLLATRSPVSYGNADAELTLVVAQALWEHGTIRLDAYVDKLALTHSWADLRAANTILAVDGHFYNYFPVGPSLLAVPVVALVGGDMTRMAENDAVQNGLSGVTVGLVLVLAYGLARSYLPAAASLFLALLFVLGTGFISILGTAFWSHNLNILFCLLVLWLMTRQATGQSDTIHPYLIGLLLFLAYSCRAAAAAFILPFFIYLFIRHRADFFQVMVSSGSLLALFFLWSRLEYGQWLPSYYDVARLQQERTHFAVALVGLLLSPARGLLVYSPFLALVGGVGLWIWRSLRPHPLVWLGLGWLVGHLVLIARAASWWGGASYGPRLLVDVLPGLFLLTVLVGYEGHKVLRPQSQHLLLVLFWPLVAWSIYLHSYQGLFNLSQTQWEIERESRSALDTLFDWHLPPFLASPQRFCQQDREALAAYQQQPDPLPLYPEGQLVGPQDAVNLYRVQAWPAAAASPSSFLRAQVYLPWLTRPTGILLSGWAGLSGDYRWSKCPEATLYLIPGDVEVGQMYRLAFLGATNGPQKVTVTVNGQLVETFTWDVSPVAPMEKSWLIPGDWLRPQELNAITFTLPDARPPNEWDYRFLALAFFGLSLGRLSGDGAASLLPAN
ncbi:MAG: hypothetical protein KA314_25460 [Chloroflexi bacterium]|nr:hypothetical protein [Chloroflexota bacterium]